MSIAIICSGGSAVTVIAPRSPPTGIVTDGAWRGSGVRVALRPWTESPRTGKPSAAGGVAAQPMHQARHLADDEAQRREVALEALGGAWTGMHRERRRLVDHENAAVAVEHAGLQVLRGHTIPRAWQGCAWRDMRVALPPDIQASPTVLPRGEQHCRGLVKERAHGPV